MMACPNCGEDLTKASMVVSTAVKPLSRPLKRGRGVGSGSKTLYIVLASIVVATAIVGLGYVPSVSARVPPLGALSSAVEGIVGQAVQWGREMMGQPAPKPRPPATTTGPEPAAARGAKTAAQPQKPPAKPQGTPQPVKPEKPPAKPQATPQHVKPAQPKPSAVKPVPKKPPSKPPARPVQKAPPTTVSATRPLTVGARAPQFVLKDLRGVLYRLPDFRGRRVALLLVSDLDQDGRAAIRAFVNRFGNHPGYSPMVVVIVTHADRSHVRRLVTAGLRVPVLLGNEQLAAAYRVPKNGGVLYVVSEQGMIAQARVIRGEQD